MQPIRLAFMGFRHGHIYSLYDLAKTHPATPGAYLNSFVAELRGKPQDATLTTTDVLEASRFTLMIQQAADKSLTCVGVQS